MTILYSLILIVHFLGLASLIGGFLVQIKSDERQVNNAMLHGAITQLVTGLLLVGLMYPLGEEPNNLKIAVKLLVLLVVLGLLLVNRKKPSITPAVWGAIGGLSIVNVAIAVLW